MDFQTIKTHVAAYNTHNQVLDAVRYLVDSYALGHENCQGFELRMETSTNSLLLTAEGQIGGKQTVYLPANILNFDLALILNMIAHEMLHVRQKAPGAPVVDKNEREWQAYYEMLFHRIFPGLPDAPDFNRIQFANKALEYYKRMGEGTPLQQTYKAEKNELTALLETLIAKKEAQNQTPISETLPLNAPNNLPQ